MSTPSADRSIPMTRQAVIDTYFMEHRGKLLDLAAFLDRIERADPPGRTDDFRVRALLECAAILGDGKPERARRILEHLSDPTPDPVPAAGVKGATGAYPGLGSGGVHP
jgi:hypothetical protein